MSEKERDAGLCDTVSQEAYEPPRLERFDNVRAVIRGPGGSGGYDLLNTMAPPLPSNCEATPNAGAYEAADCSA